MKTLFCVFIVISIYHLNGFSQNRIENWEIEEITSIHVEIKSSGDEIKIETFSSKSEIERIITFLRGVEFIDYDAYNTSANSDTNTWKYRMKFQGQRDQIYLLSNYAFIGKSRFTIDVNVIIEFEEDNLVAVYGDKENLKVSLQELSSFFKEQLNEIS